MLIWVQNLKKIMKKKQVKWDWEIKRNKFDQKQTKIRKKDGKQKFKKSSNGASNQFFFSKCSLSMLSKFPTANQDKAYFWLGYELKMKTFILFLQKCSFSDRGPQKRLGSHRTLYTDFCVLNPWISLNYILFYCSCVLLFLIWSG